MDIGYWVAQKFSAEWLPTQSMQFEARESNIKPFWFSSSYPLSWKYDHMIIFINPLSIKERIPNQTQQGTLGSCLHNEKIWLQDWYELMNKYWIKTTRRLMVYVIPVTLLSFALNIPKFIEVELLSFLHTHWCLEWSNRLFGTQLLM